MCYHGYVTRTVDALYVFCWAGLDSAPHHQPGARERAAKSQQRTPWAKLGLPCEEGQSCTGWRETRLRSRAIGTGQSDNHRRSWQQTAQPVVRRKESFTNTPETFPFLPDSSKLAIVVRSFPRGSMVADKADTIRVELPYVSHVIYTFPHCYYK